MKCVVITVDGKITPLCSTLAVREPMRFGRIQGTTRQRPTLPDQTHRHASVSSNELRQIGTCGMSHFHFQGWKQTQPQLKTCHRKMQILLGFALCPHDGKGLRGSKKTNFVFPDKHRRINLNSPHQQRGTATMSESKLWLHYPRLHTMADVS